MKISTYIAATLAVLFTSVATAQQGGTQTVALEEIVVTAARREQSLQDVPIAVTSISGDTIESFGLTSIEDFMSMVPNAIVESGTFGLQDDIVIRGGGGSIVGLDLGEQATGLYRNGYYMGGSRSVFPDQIDLRRVEVLRGPQGGLYGRNAVGGAVNFIYNQAVLDESYGSVQLRYGTHDRSEVRLIGNLPVIDDKLAVRAAAWYVNQEEGEYYNTTLNEFMDDEQSLGFRGSLNWQLTDIVSSVFEVEIVSEKTPMNVTAADGETTGTQTKETVARNTPSDADRDWVFIANTLSADTSAGVFSLLTSSRSFEIDSIDDGDQTDFPFGYVENRDESVDSFFAEAQWISPADRRVRWVAGITSFSEDIDLRLGRTASNFELAGLAPTANGTSTIIRSQETSSFAAWGQLTFDLADSVTVDLSVRATDEDKTLDLVQLNPTDGTAIPTPEFDKSGITKDFDNVSLGAGISWAVTDDVGLYAKINEGYRAGGFNTIIFSGITTAFLQPLPGDEVGALLGWEEELTTNYEIGAKTQWFDNRFQVNAAIYYIDTTDVLVSRFDFASFLFVFENGGDANANGVEIEFAAVLTDNFSFSGGFGYLSGEFTAPDAKDGTPLNGSNSKTANLNASYRVPLSNDKELVFRGAWRYRENHDPIDGVETFDGTETLQDYSMFDLSVGLEADSWFVRAEAVNVGDEEYPISYIFQTFGGLASARSAGSTYGLRVGFEF